MKEKIVLRKLWNKKKIASLLIASFIISNAPVTDWNKYIYTIKADEYDFSEWNEGYEPSYENKQKVGVNVAYHTEDEIREFVKNHPFDFNEPVEYEETPLNKAPYSLGRLKGKTLYSALNALNQIRYIAGLNSDVVLKEEYVKLAQGASVVNSVNNVMTHYPSKPAGMSDELFGLGAEGASHSNIGRGYKNINQSLIFGYMEDGDYSNIDRVGHRRWLLNPSMKATGFGYYNNYTATYAFDGSGEAAVEYGVVWPAQNMPTEYFNSEFPWSISMGYVVNDSVEVELVRVSDNKTWHFSKGSSDGYFNVNNAGYGQKGCIIFRPDGIEKYGAGEKFKVTVAGLSEPLSYEVSFFDLVPVTDITVGKIQPKMQLGDELDLNFAVLPKNAVNNLKISSDNDVLKLSNTYTKDKTYTVIINNGSEKEYNESIKANKYGKTILKAETLDGRISKTYEITVLPEMGYVYWTYIKRVKNKNYGTFQIKIEKNKKASGYEVLYSTNKNFKNAKKIVSNSVKKTKFLINKASLKNTYYVKTRTFVNVGNEKLYGDYSGVEAISY